MYKTLKNYIKITLILFINKPTSVFLAWYNFLKDYFLIKKELNLSGEKINLSMYPCLLDKKNYTLNMQYYDYQNAWAFEKILDTKPSELIDIASNISYLTFASKLTKVTTIDIREHNIPVKNLKFKIGDILNIPYPDNSIDFLSSLSVIEHVGLGRYGDKIDFNGMQKSINEFTRVLKKNGILLVSVPVGPKNIIEFNAHRRFSPTKIYKMFNNYSISDEVYILRNKIVDIAEYNSLGNPPAFACYKLLKKIVE
jgi:ubiquinone/menaquinone biosynthesis C-methylase UbiE